MWQISPDWNNRTGVSRPSDEASDGEQIARNPEES